MENSRSLEEKKVVPGERSMPTWERNIRNRMAVNVRELDQFKRELARKWLSLMPDGGAYTELWMVEPTVECHGNAAFSCVVGSYSASFTACPFCDRLWFTVNRSLHVAGNERFTANVVEKLSWRMKPFECLLLMAHSLGVVGVREIWPAEAVDCFGRLRNPFAARYSNTGASAALYAFVDRTRSLANGRQQPPRVEHAHDDDAPPGKAAKLDGPSVSSPVSLDVDGATRYERERARKHAAPPTPEDPTWTITLCCEWNGLLQPSPMQLEHWGRLQCGQRSNVRLPDGDGEVMHRLLTRLFPPLEIMLRPGRACVVVCSPQARGSRQLTPRFPLHRSNPTPNSAKFKALGQKIFLLYESGLPRVDFTTTPMVACSVCREMVYAVFINEHQLIYHSGGSNNDE